jgi:hypothetical protein
MEFVAQPVEARELLPVTILDVLRRVQVCGISVRAELR